MNEKCFRPDFHLFPFYFCLSLGVIFITVFPKQNSKACEEHGVRFIK